MKKLRLPIFLLLLIFSFGFLLSKSSPIFAQVTVKEACDDTGLTDERNPRPAACYTCSQNELLTPSCATSFEVFDEVEYVPANEGPMVKESWEGEITVNPKEINIPFVGMQNKEKESFWKMVWPLDEVDPNAKSYWAFWEVSNASENKYLADYFEGTNEYYRNYGNQTTLTNYQGVLRKLTPYEYQNQLKKQLIARVNNGEPNQIHDYKIKYIGRFCWDTPFWIDAGKFIFENIQNLITDLPPIKGILAFFSRFFDINEEEFKIELPDIGHYCLYASLQEGTAGWFIVKTNELATNLPIIGPIYSELLKISQKIPGLVHFSLDPTVDEEALSSLAKENQPPNPNKEEYQENPSKYEEDFLTWKRSGPPEHKEGYWYRLWQATPMLSREDTQGEINPFLAKEHKEDSELEFTSEESKLESVPHLARLYEGSQIISSLLIPGGDKGIEMVKTPAIPETTPPNACFKEKYTPPTNEGDSLCCQTIMAKFTAMEEFENPLYEECQTASPSASCYGTNKDVSRSFGVNINHPYLDEIWSYTTNVNGGFFNIFRPYGSPTFEDIDAAEVVKYSYNPKGLAFNGEVSPTEGLFFFPHLGGVQKAKEWVVNQALWPYEK